MADQIITITIPSEKVAIALQGFLKIYPNTETIWVDPEDGSVAPQVAKYTTSQWVKEMVRRILVRDVYRGLAMLKAETDVIIKDDTVAQ